MTRFWPKIHNFFSYNTYFKFFHLYDKYFPCIQAYFIVDGCIISHCTEKKNRFSITHFAIKKYCRLRHVNTRNLRFRSSRSQRPGIEVLAGATSPESSLLGVRMATSSL